MSTQIGNDSIGKRVKTKFHSKEFMAIQQETLVPVALQGERIDEIEKEIQKLHEAMENIEHIVLNRM